MLLAHYRGGLEFWHMTWERSHMQTTVARQFSIVEPLVSSGSTKWLPSLLGMDTLALGLANGAAQACWTQGHIPEDISEDNALPCRKNLSRNSLSHSTVETIVSILRPGCLRSFILEAGALIWGWDWWGPGGWLYCWWLCLWLSQNSGHCHCSQWDLHFTEVQINHSEQS